jgi:hypothetical protein
MAHHCPTCDVQVQIARRTLTVQTTEVNATGSHSVDYQFAFRLKDAPLRLVGVRTETSIRTADGDGRRTVASTNLLSGDRVDVVDDIVHGRKTRSEQKIRLPVREPIGLQSFAFDPAAFAEAPRAELAHDGKAPPDTTGKLSGS